MMTTRSDATTEHKFTRAKQYRIWSEILTKIVVGLMIITAMISMLVVTIRLTNVQKIVRQGNVTLTQVKRTNQLMIDCTTPGHSCWRQLESKSVAAREDLTKIIEASNYCSGHHQAASLRQLVDCVTRLVPTLR